MEITRSSGATRSSRWPASASRARVAATASPATASLYVVDGRGEIVSARTRPRLLRHRATLGADGEVLVDGRPWRSPEVAAAVARGRGPGRAARATPRRPERFDILPLLVATDGAIAAFGHDGRRLRPEHRHRRRRRASPSAAGRAGCSASATRVIALADLRGRCIMTTWRSRHARAGRRRPARASAPAFGGTLALNAWAGATGPDRGRRRLLVCWMEVARVFCYLLRGCFAVWG